MRERLVINTQEADYFARAWRTDILRKAAEREVVKMVQAFVRSDFHVRVDKVDHEVPGFPHAPNYKIMATLCDKDRDGSDAHICVHAYTEAGALAKLLSTILDGKGFFPLT
jgi:hypothetical protein